MAFCKPPPAEQQHLEEVQKQRADNQQRAAEAAKHKRKPGRTQGRLRHAQHSQQGQNEAAGEQAPASGRRRGASRTRCNWWHPAVIIPVLESRSLQMCWQEG